MKIAMRNVLIVVCSVFILSFSLGGCGKNTTSILKENQSRLLGIITDVEKQIPLPKVEILITNSNNGKEYKTKTDSSGQYSIICEPGYYSLLSTKKGYSEYKKSIVVGKGQNQEDFYLAQSIESPCELDGKVVDYTTKEPIPGATVQMGRNITRTNEKGEYTFEKPLPIGTYDTWVSAPGYELLQKQLSLSKGRNKAQFELLPFDSSISAPQGNQNTPSRNPIAAIDPSYLNDYKVSITKVLKPENATLLYHVVMQDRYNSTLESEEPNFIGKILVTDQGCYEKVNKQNWTEVQQSEILQPDAVFRPDIESLLYYFNFVDPGVTITEIGKEKVGIYPCVKYNIRSIDGTPQDKVFDMNAWIIKDPNFESRLLNCLVRIQGTAPKSEGIWYDIDMTFSEIGNNNKVTIPKDLPK